MTGAISIKRGAALSLAVAATNSDGSAFDLTGLTISSWLRTAQGAVLCLLTVVVTNAAAGQFTVTAPGTSSWPIGMLVGDFRFTNVSGASLSDTFTVSVNQEVTSA